MLTFIEYLEDECDLLDPTCWDGEDSSVKINESEYSYDGAISMIDGGNLDEAEYQGRTVKLGKPSQGDVKKFKVYVMNDKGNVIKVNFGDPNMRIRKSNPAARKSFRARHKCDTKKDRTTAGYWSCSKW